MPDAQRQIVRRLRHGGAGRINAAGLRGDVLDLQFRLEMLGLRLQETACFKRADNLLRFIPATDVHQQARQADACRHVVLLQRQRLPVKFFRLGRRLGFQRRRR